MKNLLCMDKVFDMMVFICLINLTPDFGSLMTFFLTDHLHFTTEDLADFASFGTVCYILALVLYSYYLMDVDPKNFYIVTNFILFIVNISFLVVVLDLTT